MRLKQPLANAPASWGVFYPSGNAVTPEEYLDALWRTGYGATELGPFGWMPTDPAALGDLLAARSLGLTGAADVHVFSDPGKASELIPTLDAIARLIVPLGAPHLVLMDESEAYPKDAMGVVPADIRAAAHRLIETARKHLAETHGVTLHFHPHVGTLVEFEPQIEQLLDETGVSLCFDTGHHAFWDQDVPAFMTRHAARIGYVHLKNVSATLRAEVIAGRLGLDAAFEAGAMAPLADGAVDIAGVVRALAARGFTGPVVVEQDPSRDASPEALALQNRQFLAKTLEKAEI